MSYYEYLINVCAVGDGKIAEYAYRAKTSSSFPKGRATVGDILTWVDDHCGCYEMYSAAKRTWEMYKAYIANLKKKAEVSERE